MHGTFDAGFGSQGFGGPGGPGRGGPRWRGAGRGDHMWEAMEQFREAFMPPRGQRMGRGDVRAAVIALLAEQPMHGYQIIHQIEERSGGAWKPSPGSVYPTLQLLTDEGLLTATEADGRKTYELTEGGRAEAEAAKERHAPWLAAEGEQPQQGRRDVAKAGFELAQAAAQVARSGNPEQVEHTISVLDDARRRLYSILAEG